MELMNSDKRNFKLREMIEPVVDRYDYILIDCPPSLSILTINGLLAAQNGVLIPVQCEYLALEGLGQLTDTLQRIKRSLFPELDVRGVILTMYDGRTRLAMDVVRRCGSSSLIRFSRPSCPAAFVWRKHLPMGYLFPFMPQPHPLPRHIRLSPGRS